MIQQIIIWLFWFGTAAVLCVQHAQPLSAISKWSALIAVLIFFIGAPFFLIANVLEEILNSIFPENWDEGVG